MSIETHLVSLRTYMEEMTSQQREIVRLLKQLTGEVESPPASTETKRTPAPKRTTRKKATT